MYSPNRLIFNIPPRPLHRAKIDSKCWVPGLSYFYCFETPVLWPPHAKSWLIGKDSDAGRDWGQEEKGTTEDEMAGWHHWLDGRESQWTPGVGDGQGGLACCDSWGRKESDMTERLIWSDLIEIMLEACYGSLDIKRLKMTFLKPSIQLWFVPTGSGSWNFWF